MNQPLSIAAFDFLTPQKVLFGWGRLAELGQCAKSLGRRAFVVCGSRTLRDRGVMDELAQLLKKAGVESRLTATISHEPEVSDVDRTTAEVVASDAGDGDFVLAVGGGSAIDLAKAVAAMATNRQGDTVQDFLEGVGRGLSLTEPPLPLLAVPTTAGTGTEATKNSVISSYDPPFKKSLRSDLMVPRVVLIDPELTVTVPPDITAQTGMDAITQLIESYVSRRAKPIPQALCLKGLELAIPSVVEATENGQSRPAREAMCLAALLSGIALANSGLGMAHGVAAALGVHVKIPHGLACAVMLPTAMRVNQDARTAELARLGALFTGQPWSPALSAAEAEGLAAAAVEFIERLCARLEIPRRLSELGVSVQQIPALVRSSRGNSMDGNPRQLDDQELHQILEALL